jgi:hypothetical protein
MAGYWLLDWIDREGVRSPDEAAKALIGRGLEGFLAGASEAASAPSDLVGGDQTIIAGAGMDLSGQLDCAFFECQRRRVDELLSRVWHYFDEVVVCGLDPQQLSAVLKACPEPEAFVQAVMPHLQVAFYLRESGADRALTFAAKPARCEEHLRQHAAEAGLIDIDQKISDFVDTILDGYETQVVPDGEGSVTIAWTHPAVGLWLMQRGVVEKEARDLRAVVEGSASSVAARYISDLIRTVVEARENDAAMGQVTYLADVDMVVATSAPRVSEVAFNLQLPVLEAIAVRELLAIREAEATEFQAFRSALRAGINEQMRAMPLGTAAEVAGAVYDDLVEPALLRLDRKLNAAADVLTKRSVAGVGVGTVLACVGGLVLAPLAIPGAILGLGAGLQAFGDYAKERGDAKQEPMYFLWRLEQAARHGA